MDTAILFTVFLSFVVFVLLQIIVFRRIPRRQVLVWMVIVFVAAGFIANITLLLLKHDISGNMLLFFLGISWLLYGLISLIYILALFGIVESSIRIRLLAEVIRSGEKGITLKELYRKYNREVIIKKRLERFVASGDISFDGTYYMVKRKLSMFSLPGAVFSVLWKLYRD